jgi:hypothetical protein
MASEKYNNLAASTLNGAIDNAVTSLVVTSASTFPASGDFRIVIDTEIMLVTGVSGTTFTVTRGAESTTPASHSNTASVTHVVTAASIDRIVHQGVCGQDVIGSRPSAGDAGRLFIPTSGLTLQRDTGTVWTPHGPLHTFTQGFAVADYTGVNTTGGSTAVIADQGGIIHISKPGQNGINVSYWVKTAPSPPYTIEAAFNAFWSRSSLVPCFGLCFANSGATPMGPSAQHTNTTHIQVVNYTSNTAQSFHLSVQECIAQPIWWFRISDDGTTNKRYWVSIDGVNWHLLFSHGRTTTYTPNQVGFFLDSQSAPTSQVDMHVNLLSWKQTTDSV